MIGSIVRPLCVLSILCGVLLSLTPEGSVKRIAELACTCVLLISVIGTAGAETSELSFSDADISHLEDELSENAEKTRTELSGMVIQRECEEYIMEKADALGIVLREVTVGLRHTEEQDWSPWNVTLESEATGEEKSLLSGIIRTDLGIPYERQSWNENG